MLRSRTSITSNTFPVTLMMLAGAMLTTGTLPAQENQWIVPDNNWANLSEAGSSTGLRAYVIAKRGSDAVVNAAKAQALGRHLGLADAQASATLPLWFYNAVSPRDNKGYFGIVVGNDPFNVGGTARVPTYIIPVIITTNTVGVSSNSNTGVITTAAGVTTFDPTAADNVCMAAPNNVPATVLRQSPIFENTSFIFGGTDVGNTQYLDAFQRASFWKVLKDQNEYHVLLDPVNELAPVAINVPAAYGTTLPTSSTSGVCGRVGIIDVNWLDNYLSTVVLPALAAQGVNTGSFPIFTLHNTVESLRVTNLNYCCTLGYHGVNGPPVQTYAVVDFDTSRAFSPAAQDTGSLSHEIGDWMNDPVGSNYIPAWGHTGQVSGCDSSLEAGDPLTGNLAPSIVMPNGFTYHLQEMAFYSWFLGGPSIALSGWYSNNASFVKDAGPPCH